MNKDINQLWREIRNGLRVELFSSPEWGPMLRLYRKDEDVEWADVIRADRPLAREILDAEKRRSPKHYVECEIREDGEFVALHDSVPIQEEGFEPPQD